MALITCNECGAEISSKAQSCPKCGDPVTDNERANVVVQTNDSGSVAAMMAISQKKSMGMGILLTFLFGPLGLLYATVGGGIVMIILTIVVGIITLGLGFILGWLISIIWAAVSISSHNSKSDARIARAMDAR